jgi:hypothetical protein
MVESLQASVSSFRIHLPAFLIAFVVGLAYVFMIQPPPKVIVTHPSPYNSGKVTYEDDTGTCFMFDAKKVTCPSNEKEIRPQPVMVGNVSSNHK